MTEGGRVDAQIDLDDLAAPEATADPYAFYGRLRESDSVHWNEKWKAWMVTRYADVTWMIRKHELFPSAPPPMEPREVRPPIADEDWELVESLDVDIRGFLGVGLGMQGLVTADRPAHLEMRQALHRSFTPKAVERWRENLRTKAHELIDARFAEGEMEIKNDLATPLSLTTIGSMLDIPQADEERLRDLTEAFTTPGFGPNRMRRPVLAMRELQEYFDPLLDERSKTEGDDLISLLAAAELRGVYNRSQSIADAILLMAAGHETTLNLIANGLLTFIQNPDQWDLLRSNAKDLCVTATEECLRYEPSILLAFRVCKQDTELSDQVIRADDLVFWVIASANRDPRAFVSPDTFDITRSPNPHVAFGGGIHHCLGAALARIEAQEVFRALAERFPRFRLNTGELEYVPDLHQRQLMSLHVQWQI